MIKPCKTCQKIYNIRGTRWIYCSFVCRDKDADFIQKISTSKLGNRNPMKRPEVQAKAKVGWFTPERVSGDRNVNWGGGVYIQKPGYIFHLKDKKYLSEHRSVMESALGRALSRYEIVHHINHNPSDNRPENLKVMSQSEHIKIHLKERKIK